MAATTTSPTRITVSTTLPKVEDYLPTLDSDRLILRPLLISDLEEFHTLRSQPETMALSPMGGVASNQNVDETLVELQRLQPPYPGSHVYFGIFLKKEDNREGQLIGEGGVHKFASTLTGWPEFRFIFKKEHWHLKYETEFTTTFMKFWWSLIREKANILVVPNPSFAQPQGADTEAKELVYAYTRPGVAYQLDTWIAHNTLQRIGFDKKAYKGLLNENFDHWQLTKDLFHKDQVLTTRPHPFAGNRPKPITTNRLILRPLLISDFEAYHSLRKDPEVMHLLRGGEGRPDENKSETESETRKDLEYKQPGSPFEDQFCFGIFLKKSDNHEGELIGEVGVTILSNSWPLIYYYSKKKHWGKGYASEFVPSFISFWWSLPRMDTYLRLNEHPKKIRLDYEDKETEQLWGRTHVKNTRSRKVLEKAEFEEVEVSEDTVYWRYISHKK